MSQYEAETKEEDLLYFAERIIQILPFADNKSGLLFLVFKKLGFKADADLLWNKKVFDKFSNHSIINLIDKWTIKDSRLYEYSSGTMPSF